MDQPVPVEDKKSFLRNDRRLVCSMFIIYGLCILGLVAGTFWGLDRRNKELSAAATSTAITRRTNNTATAKAIATQQAHATATVIARTTEQAGYGFIERFDKGAWFWSRGPHDGQDWKGSKEVKQGIYAWNIVEAREPLISFEYFLLEQNIEDFDVYVDSKVVKGNPGDVCTGLEFLESPHGWDKGAYLFEVCNDSYSEVMYSTPGNWDRLCNLKHTNAVHNSDWNRIHVSARGDHFTMTVNNVEACEMTDARPKWGSLAIFIALNEAKPAVIWFDNFGYQRR